MKSCSKKSKFKILRLLTDFKYFSFRNLQSKWHPDLYGSRPSSEQDKSQQMSTLANKAYQARKLETSL